MGTTNVYSLRALTSVMFSAAVVDWADQLMSSTLGLSVCNLLYLHQFSPVRALDMLLLRLWMRGCCYDATFRI